MVRAHGLRLEPVYLPYFAGLCHIGNAKLFDNNAKQFVRVKKPLAYAAAKEFAWRIQITGHE
jgi:hypothetical protein